MRAGSVFGRAARAAVWRAQEPHHRIASQSTTNCGSFSKVGTSWGRALGKVDVEVPTRVSRRGWSCGRGLSTCAVRQHPTSFGSNKEAKVESSGAPQSVPAGETETVVQADNNGKDKDETDTKKMSKVEQLIATVRQQKADEGLNLNFVQLVEDAVDKKRLKPSLISRYPIHRAEYRTKLWIDVKDWAHHMKMGSKLLWTETMISFQLLRRLLQGGSLTRRERQQFVRTLSDLLRLVPFSLFIIIPFAELALPLALRIFPSLLPSTFQEAKKEEAKLATELKVKLEMATFLQETVEEMAATRKGDISDDLRGFLRMLEKGRAGAQMTQTSELLKYTKLFDDVVTLDNLSRRQLIALNRLLLLPTIGTDGVLNFQIRYRLKRLRADDMLIRAESVSSLSVPELQAACRERGMRALGISEDGLKSRLEQWLHLNLDVKVPATLLLLSRILYLPETMDASEQIAATIEQMPDTLKRAAKMAAVETEGGKVTAQEKLEIIAEQQAKIEAERLAKIASTVQALPISHVLEYEDANGFKVTEVPKQITIPDLSPEELFQLTAAFGEVAKAKDSTTVFAELKAEHLENVEDMKTLQEMGAGEIELARASVILSKQVSKLLQKVEDSVQSESPDVFAQNDEASVPTPSSLDLNNDGMIATEEILAVLKDAVSKENEINLRRLMNVIDADHDGIVKVETLQKIMDAIHQEGIDTLMKLEGDASLQMVVEAIEREAKAKEAVEKKKKKDKKDKKTKEKDSADMSTDNEDHTDAANTQESPKS
eukprot:m.249755 g.249755  ORF g.249755 m.249755 type:complete len:772 (-) comp26490_c0_seq5:789-3104(-)